MPWRDVALVCFFIPVLTMIAVCFVSFLTEFFWESTPINVFPLPFFRFLRLLCGCCRKIEKKMPRNHYNGYVDGQLKKVLRRNSLNCNDIVNAQSLVICVWNKIKCAYIKKRWRRRGNSPNWLENVHWNHFSLWFSSFSSLNSPDLARCDRIWFKFWKLIEHQLKQIRQP